MSFPYPIVRQVRILGRERTRIESECDSPTYPGTALGGVHIVTFIVTPKRMGVGLEWVLRGAGGSALGIEALFSIL